MTVSVVNLLCNRDWVKTRNGELRIVTIDDFDNYVKISMASLSNKRNSTKTNTILDHLNGECRI